VSFIHWRSDSVIKARRGHIEEIERDEHGHFKESGGLGSQGGKRKAPENRHDARNGEPKSNPSGSGHAKEGGKGGKVGSIHWFTQGERMHRPLPKKPLKPRYAGGKHTGSTPREKE
jgi:hypothetical protein